MTVRNGLMAAVGGATWRHLHGVVARSDERRRGDAWGEGRWRYAYGARKDRRLERTHTNHWLLHWRDLRKFRGIYCTCQMRKLFVILPSDIVKTRTVAVT